VADHSVALPVEADLAGAHPVDFYVQIALERNPEILAAQQSAAAQAEVVPQATALDDPVLADSFFPFTGNSPQTASGRAPNTLALQQRYPWFGKLRLRGEIAEEETRIATTRLAQAQLKVVEEVHLAYYEIHFHQQAIRVTEQNRKLLEDLISIADTRYRAGATSQQDVLRAQVELEKIQDTLIALRRGMREAQADLAKVLHASPETEVKSVDFNIPSVPEEINLLYETALQCRPELHEQLHAIMRDQRALELARLQYYPDATLGVNWQAITTSDALSGVANGHDNVGFLLGVNLPIWRDKLRAGVCEAQHRVAASTGRYDATRDETTRLIRRLMVQARANEEQMQLFRDRIIPKADQALQVSATDYRVGKVDFQQLVENWSDLLRLQIQLARLEASLAQTLASLERTVGCKLASPADMESPPAPDPPQ
jgi:outer membrane protein TolC